MNERGLFLMRTVEKVDKNVVSFEFSVSAEEFETAVQKAYKKNVGKIKRIADIHFINVKK